MAALIRRRYGRLGLQLTLAFVTVAVGAVIAANIVFALTVYSDARRLLVRQEANQAKAVALGAAVTYTRGDWARALKPVIAVADRSGASVQIRDSAGRVVRSSPGYGSYPPGPTRTEPIRVGGKGVGSVTVKSDDHGVGAIIGHFESRRWHARLSAVGVGALFALIVALLVAPLIAGPIDRLLRAVRAQGSGQPGARVGEVKGLSSMRELTVTFDQMADNLSRQDQLRRNLVADIVHGLRTPIAVLQASTEAILDGIHEPTDSRVTSLHDEAVRLGQMVDGLQRLAAAEAAATQLRLVQSDLAAISAAAADSLANIVDHAGIRLERRLTAVNVRCDRIRMREMVTNLLTNAVKFTPRGGRVMLETGPAADMAMLRVSDTGVGVPPEDLPHLSERFYRGREAAEVSGSGIGLTIVDELVRGHHGSLDIASQPGQGTQVTILLPRAEH
jgi:two-component system sensor histidine kinase BaeS